MIVACDSKYVFCLIKSILISLIYHGTPQLSMGPPSHHTKPRGHGILGVPRRSCPLVKGPRVATADNRRPCLEGMENSKHLMLMALLVEVQEEHPQTLPRSPSKMCVRCIQTGSPQGLHLRKWRRHHWSRWDLAGGLNPPCWQLGNSIKSKSKNLAKLYRFITMRIDVSNLRLLVLTHMPGVPDLNKLE